MSQRKPVVVIKVGEKLTVPSAQDCAKYLKIAQGDGGVDGEIIAIIVSDNARSVIGDNSYVAHGFHVMEDDAGKGITMFVVSVESHANLVGFIAQITQESSVFDVHGNAQGSVSVSMRKHVVAHSSCQCVRV